MPPPIPPPQPRKPGPLSDLVRAGRLIAWLCGAFVGLASLASEAAQAPRLLAVLLLCLSADRALAVFQEIIEGR